MRRATPNTRCWYVITSSSKAGASPARSRSRKRGASPASASRTVRPYRGPEVPARKSGSRRRRPGPGPHGRLRDVMDKRERVLAALGRKPVDRPPVSFWRHVPDVDHTAPGLAEAMLAFQRRWDLDFVKVMSSGVYCVEDWRFAGALVGGLSEGRTLLNGPAEAVAAEVRDALAQTGGLGVMIGPGCVLPLATPDAHLAAVVAAVKAAA